MNPYIINGGLSVDDRGYVSFVNDFDFRNVKRFYVVDNHERGFIRAWHGHKNEEKYVYVVKGSILIGLVSMDDSEEVQKFVLSERLPKILYIPSNFFNGFQTLEENTKVIFFSTTMLSESLKDDYREDYDRWNIWEKNYR